MLGGSRAVVLLVPVARPDKRERALVSLWPVICAKLTWHLCTRVN